MPKVILTKTGIIITRGDGGVFISDDELPSLTEEIIKANMAKLKLIT